MLVVHSRLIPFENYDAINILGMLFYRERTTITADPIQHEHIHTRQITELRFVFSCLFYVIEWLIHLPISGRVYLNISFEREAYRHMNDPSYLLNRRPYAWTRYLKNPDKSRMRSPKKSN